jgi:nucleotide-binding universal stress UspA family protein
MMPDSEAGDPTPSVPPTAGDILSTTSASSEFDPLQFEHTSAGSPGVLVGIDGSESATAALEWAGAEAALRDRPLTIVYVDSPRVTGHLSARPVSTLEVLRTTADELLDDAAATVRRRWPDLAITRVARSGGVVPRLVDESAGKELAVVGSRGLGGFRGLLLGSVGIGMASHAPCPVIVVRGDAPLPTVGAEAPIVVGVDGSHHADQALFAAFEEASRRRCPLFVVHSWQDPTTDSFTAEDEEHRQPEFDERDWTSYASQRLATTLASFRLRFPDVAVTPSVEWRRPNVALQERAEGAQLLVVGNRGRSPLASLVLGSTSRVMIQQAPCPVLVVRGDPPSAADTTSEKPSRDTPRETSVDSAADTTELMGGPAPTETA